MVFLATLAPDGQREFLARFEVQRGGQVPGADGRPLRVHHDAGGKVALPRGGADVADDTMDPIVQRVGHVEPKDIHARVEEMADHFRGIGGRPESGNDPGFSHTSDLRRQSYGIRHE